MTEPRVRTSRARPAEVAKASRRTKIWVAVAGVVVLASIGVLFLVMRADARAHLSLPIDVPASHPTGDPIHVAYAVKPDDVFVTEWHVKNRIVSALLKGLDTKEGMQFDAQSTVGHAILAQDDGTMRSKVVLHLDRVDTDIPTLRDDLWSAIGRGGLPYTVLYERDAAGRPTGKVHPDAGAQIAPGRRLALDAILSGLSDVATSWLPPHDVRLGETWDVASVADVLPQLEGIFRRFAQRQDKPDGYPRVVSKAVLQAAAREPRDGEDCLRLRLAVLLEMEGETVLPAYPGWISGAATLDGSIWVSVSTGVLWGVDVKSAIVSSYRNEVLPPQERRSEGTVAASTHRAKEMP